MYTSLKQFAQLTIDNNKVGLPTVAADSTLLVNILNAVFMVIGAAAVLVIVLAAIDYVISNGDQTRVKRAKDAILYAVIGIIVSLSAFTIVQFVVGRF